ncbi:MAG: hypothetical protein OQJ89_14665, partial [Kangiellaceae bacterium]|nr:hypothetical protein [Kangiellaceae bacterium]
DYICAIGYDKESAFAQAEAMVAVVFNAGAESLDAKPGQRKQIARRAVTQLRFIASGAKQHRMIKTKGVRT